jgi:hypothetical protein
VQQHISIRVAAKPFVVWERDPAYLQRNARPEFV